MKILHIVPSYKPAYVYGGPIESVARLCEGLVAAGHTVHVYTTTANGPTELDVVPGKTVDVDGVQVTYFKRITKDPTHISPALWTHLYKAANDYDVIHIHSWWNILVMVAAKICLLKGTKVIIAPRGMLSHYIFNSGSSKAKKLMHNFFGRSLLKKCYFHATAEAEYRECRELIPAWEGFIQPNIISLPDIPVQHHPNEVFTLIFLSRVHPKKGLDLLFRAISRLNFNVLLKIAGDGDETYMTSLKQLASDLSIADKIEWLGWKKREEKFTELMQADLFVLVSLNENFANVVIESLHVGTAVLISEDVALADFVTKQNAGWISTLDVNNIAELLTDAKAQTGKLAQIRANGRQIIEDNFSEKILIDSYVASYEHIIGK
ncbi:XrtY-associated glycosyltransferase XYAG1 [Mucilaginibacter terrae]|uniref:XrtY-associated glycosyltransferase XYAG1 n=1 Tax=Mucilaginibacter terrae TaxID=1955052 RepID=UPI00363A2B95